MNKADEIRRILDKYPSYQDTLFCRGYLITSKHFNNLSSYPFYNQWEKAKCCILKNNTSINIYYHRLQSFYSYEENGITIFIIGHAYNPFNMKYQEVELLKECLHAYRESEEAFFDKINQLTGIHLIVLNDKNRLIAVQDCAGMKSCYFGKVNNDIYITSHPQLVGDLCNLEVDPFVDKLVKSRCYNIGNRHLPGNITPFKELKRLGGNTYLEYVNEFKIRRFYPLRPHKEINSKEQFDRGVEQIADILHRNIESI